MIQTRNYCRECKREWLDGKYVSNSSGRMTITGNPDNGINCIICGSPETEIISYNNLAGFDIPRDGQVIRLPKAETITVIDRHHIRTDIPKPLLAAMQTMEDNNKLFQKEE